MFPGQTWSQADEIFVDSSEGFHSPMESGHYKTTAESVLLLDKQFGEHRSHGFPWFLLFFLREHCSFSASEVFLYFLWKVLEEKEK